MGTQMSFNHKRVLAFAKQRGESGFIDIDLERHFSNTKSTLRSRRQELTQRGLIVFTGQTCRLDGDHRSRKIWRIAK